MAVHTLTILGWIPTPLNQLRKRGGWIKKKRDRERIANELRFRPIPPAEGRRRVTIAITFPKGRRSCDPDAYYKSAHDALKHAGLIVNDSMAWIELTPPVYLRGEKAKTEIELEDVCPLPKTKRPRKPRPPKP